MICVEACPCGIPEVSAAPAQQRARWDASLHPDERDGRAGFYPQAMLLVPTFNRLSVTMYFAWLTLEYGGYVLLGPTVWFQPGTCSDEQV